MRFNIVTGQMIMEIVLFFNHTQAISPFFVAKASSRLLKMVVELIPFFPPFNLY